MPLFGLYIDPLYLLIFILSLVISAGAQLYISSQYKKWGKVQNGPHLTGREIGYAIVNRTTLGGEFATTGVDSQEVLRLADLRKRGIITDEEFVAAKRKLSFSGTNDVRANSSTIAFENIGGELTDHYDPRSHTVRMSQATADKRTVAAMAIVAHELGHAQQHENKSFLMTMRNVLVPAVRFSPRIAYLLIFIGLIFNLTGAFLLGILFYALVVLFAILTLPVEIDASRRGLKLLEQAGLMVTNSDRTGSRQILTAAAATYLAAAITAVLQLLYYITIANRRR